MAYLELYHCSAAKSSIRLSVSAPDVIVGTSTRRKGLAWNGTCLDGESWSVWSLFTEYVLEKFWNGIICLSIILSSSLQVWHGDNQDSWRLWSTNTSTGWAMALEFILIYQPLISLRIFKKTNQRLSWGSCSGLFFCFRLKHTNSD